MHGSDPTATDPELYSLVFENDRVRVLEYRDVPGDRTHLHRHPDSVMVTLSEFQRRVSLDGRQVDLECPAGQARWLSAQEHTGENIGGTGTHVLFIELKGTAPTPGPDLPLGPSALPGSA